MTIRPTAPAKSPAIPAKSSVIPVKNSVLPAQAGIQRPTMLSIACSFFVSALPVSPEELGRLFRTPERRSAL